MPGPPAYEGPRGYVEGESRELVEERTEKSKTFANPDGTRTTNFYAGPMHYEQSPGQWADIDSAWIEAGSGLVSKASPVTNGAPAALDSGWVTTTAPDGAIAFRPQGVTAGPPSVTSPYHARYSGVFPGTDFGVFSNPFSIKSEFVVTDSASLRSAYVYEIATDLSPSVTPDGGYEWRDSSNKAVFVTPGGIAHDAKYSLECIPASEAHGNPDSGGVSGDHPSQDCIGRAPGNDAGQGPDGANHVNESSSPVALSVSSGGSGAWLLTATVDPTWATHPTREFPITIDPGANWFVRADTFITSKYPDLNRWDYESNAIPGHKPNYAAVRRVGQSASYGHNRTLFHLTPDDADGAEMSEIFDVKLNVYVHSEVNKSKNPWWILPTTDWEYKKVTWNNQPQYSTTHSGYMNIRDGAWMSSRDPKLTEAVRNWLNGAWTSRGIALDGGVEEYKLVASAFDANPGHRPHLNVTYGSPPEIAMPKYPADGAVTETETPQFAHHSATDRDGDQVRYQIRVSTDPSLKSGLVVASGWSTDANRIWKPDSGVLRNDTTYYWGVFTSDGSSVSPSDILRPAPPGWLRSIRIDSRGIGAKPGYSIQSYPVGSRASFSVNAESGNLMASVSGPELGTAVGGFGANFNYNSRSSTPKGLTGSYYSPFDRDNTFSQEHFRMNRSDAQIAFSWGDALWAADINEDSYAVRWRGFIDIPQNVQLATVNDDGARVFIGDRGGVVANRLLIDAWTDSAEGRPTYSTETIVPGRYPITVEYYQHTDPASGNFSTNASMFLAWNTDWATDPNYKVVPAKYLSSQPSRLPERWSLSLPTGMGLSPRQVEILETQSAVLHGTGGTSYTFTYKDGAYLAPEELHGAVLARAGDGTFSLGLDDGSLVYFDADGKLTSALSAPDTEVRTAPFQAFWSSDELGPRLTEIRDLAGRSVSFEYEPVVIDSPVSGYLKSIHYFDGSETSIEYGPLGGLWAINNPGAERVSFGYNSAGLISTGRGARSHDEGADYRTTVQYDTGPNPARLEDYRVTAITAPAPDPSGDPLTVTYRDASPSPAPYGAATHYREIVDPAGLVSLMGFDSARRHLYSRDPSGLEAAQVFDEHSNVIEAKGPDGAVTYFDYDSSGNLILTRGPKTDPATGIPVMTINRFDEGISGLYGTYYANKDLSGAPSGQGAGPALVRTDDAINFNWGAGKPDPGMSENNFSVRWTGEIEIPAAGDYRFIANSDDGVRVWLGATKIIDDWSEHQARDAVSTYYTLPAGKLPVRVEYFEAGGDASVRLDWEGPGIGRTPVPASKLSPGYGLTTSSIGPDGTKTSASYGTKPHLRLPARVEAETRSPTGEASTLVSTAEYTTHGRVTRTVRQPGTSAEQATSYEYYGFSESASFPSECQIPGGSGPGAGMVKRVVYPDGRAAESVIYDGASRPVAARLGTGSESWACLRYDDRGRTVRVRAAEPTSLPSAVDPAGSVAYQYNGDDALLVADDASGGLVTQSFDRLGRLVTHTDANANTTTFSYDPAGRPLSSDGPAGTKGIEYDSFGRKSAATWNFGGLAQMRAGYSYDYAGRLDEMTRSNSTATRYFYSRISELTGIEHKGPGGSSMARFGYERDRLGRISASYGPEGKRGYSYDDAGRLDTVDSASIRRIFGFDTHTNRKSREDFAAQWRLADQGQPSPARFGPSAGSYPTFRYSADEKLIADPGASADARMVFGPDSWGDVSVETKVAMASGAIDAGVDLRFSDGGASRYIVALRATDTAIHKVRGHVLNAAVEKNTAVSHNPGQAYALKVVIDGATIKVFEDGVQTLSYTDPEGSSATEYSRAGFDQGAVALSSYMTNSRFDYLKVTSSRGDVLLEDHFPVRAPSGGWGPSGEDGIAQTGLNAGEGAGAVLTGSNISGSYEIRAEMRFDDGPAGAEIDGGIRFARDPGTGGAYTLALRKTDTVLFAPDGSVAQSGSPTNRELGRTYSITIRVRGSFIEIFQDGAGIFGYTGSVGTGEVAPYSWTSAMTIPSLLVAPIPPVGITTYGYNTSDQMTRAGNCSATDSCIEYDYRGNTTKLAGDTYRFDSSNRLVASESTPNALPANPNPIKISPDGSAILFSSNRDGNDEIYLTTPDGSSLTRLTANPARDLYPSFSPDGTRIFFSSDRDGDEEIYSMAADGSDVKRLTISLGLDSYPAPSPDGSEILFTSNRDSNSELYLMDTDGENQTRLTTSPETSENFARWAPAQIGRKVVMTVSTPGLVDLKIAVLDLDTSQTTTLSSSTIDAFAEWRGDGARLVFTSFVDGDDEIFTMAPDGSDRLRLTNRVGVDSAATYRPDGSIMFVSDRSGALEIYTMAEDGTGVTQLTTGAALTSVPRATDQVPLRVQASYKYDALGRLREIATSQGALSQTIRYGYSGPVDSHSYTANSSGEIETANWSGTGGLIATAHATAGSYVASWYYFDQRGDTRAIADNGGQMTWSASYSEYGEIDSSSGGSPQYGFVGAYGRISNPATGLIHMGARMYQPNLGRFLSRDPVTGGSANDYEYTGGDPINRQDVSGMSHGCTVYPNPGCKTSPEVDAIVCKQGVDAGVAKVIGAFCHPTQSGGYGIGKAGGTFFIIDTRTGQIIARDLGRSDVARRLRSSAGFSWSDFGSDLATTIPYYGKGVCVVKAGGKGVKEGIACSAGWALDIAGTFLTPAGQLVVWGAQVVVVGSTNVAGQLAGY